MAEERERKQTRTGKAKEAGSRGRPVVSAFTAADSQHEMIRFKAAL